MQSDSVNTAEGFADLHTEVLDKLRTMILDGEFPPGSHIIERLVCERLGISRTPLREVLRVLAAEGMVDLLPNRGARVAEFREKDMREAFEVMATLEGLAGRLAVVNATDDEIAEIRAMHYQMYAHFLRHELPPYFELNRKIHARIVELSRNSVLQVHLGILSRRVAHARYADYCWTDEFWASAMKEHDNILDFLMRRDGESLARQLQDHLINKLHSMIAGFHRQAEAEEGDTAQVQPIRRGRKRSLPAARSD